MLKCEYICVISCFVVAIGKVKLGEEESRRTAL